MGIHKGGYLQWMGISGEWVYTVNVHMGVHDESIYILYTQWVQVQNEYTQWVDILDHKELHTCKPSEYT